MRYNPNESNNNPLFACYASTSTTGTLPFIYKKVETGAYNIEVASGIENGTVTPSKSTSDGNETITVTVTPDAGYELATLTYTPEGGSATAITASGGVYSFMMPAANVTINATFSKAWNTIAYTVSPANSGEVWVNPSGDSGFGTVTIDGNVYTTTQMGTSVTIKLVPGNGYSINTLNITDANGAPVSYNTGETNGSHNGWGTYYTFQMPDTAVTIAATFKQGDLYILGTANDNAWDGNTGVLMTYDGDSNTYSARVYFAGNSSDDAYGKFSFTTRLSGANGSWANMGKRYGATEQDYSLVGQTGTWTDNNQDNPNRFQVPAGVYDITVNWGTGVVTATPVTITVALDKAAGQIEAGTTVNVSSNLTALLSAIKSGVSATLAYSTNGGTNYTDGSSFVVNNSLTAKGKAYYGYIEAVTDAYAYTAVTHYAVTATAEPANGGTVSVSPTSAIAGETVTVTANPANGYELTSITVNGTAIEAVEGVYSFPMPAQATTVVANFAIVNYNITVVETNCSVDVVSTANYNQQVTFTVTPRSDKYEVSTVTVTYGNGSTKPVTDIGNGTYSFYMPAADVTITVVCERKSTGGNQFTLVTAQTDIVAGGEYVILNAATDQAMTKTSSNNYDAYSTNYTLNDVIVTLSDGSDVSILKFSEGSTSGTFKIQDGTLYLTAANKKLNATSNGSDWTVTLGSNNNVTIQSGDYIIKNNSDYFRCYSSSTGTLVKLYKRLPGGVGVEIDPASGEVIGAQTVSVGSDTDGAQVQYKVEKKNGSNWDVVTNWTNWTTYTEANGPVEFTVNGNVGDVYQVTARAKESNQEVEPGEEEDFDEKIVQYTFVAPDAPTITPASKSIIDVKQNVTIESSYTNGTIEYSLDGGETWTAYSGAFDVILGDLGSSATVQARVTVNGVTSEVASATYTRNVQPVVFSPVSGTYYYGTQNVEMFSITPGARIYYTMTDDGTEPADPVMGTGTLYTDPIEDLEAGKTYKFKAYAYIGTTMSALSTAEYTIEAHNDSYWQNVAAMNADNGVTKYFENPVQVVYMSTFQNNGKTPEFCYVRDNSGYGLIYFAKNHTAYNGYTKFQMGDWLPGKSVQGTTGVWNGGFHNELGNSSGAIDEWPSESAGHTTILPEHVTNAQIKAGWDDTQYDGSDYSTGVTANNLWGHYIHLRNNTLANVADYSADDTKHKGIMTDQDGQVLTYYDVFYKFSGHNGAKHYDQSFFDARQAKGATFDFYGIVAFYGPDINKDEYANQPFQIVPLDILWVYKPVINGVNSTDVYASTQTVTLTLDQVEGDDESNSVIWYKTSEMEDFAIYTGPFEVSTSTTIETYTTKLTSYNDRMESVHETMDVHFTVINPPVIAPESQVKAVGSESVNSTITRDEADGLSNVTIFFTIDGSDPSDPNNERYVYNAQNQAAMLSDIRTTTTVRAVAAVGNDQDGYTYSAEAEARTYTFVKSNGIEYDLLTDINDLTSNGVYVIVSRKYSEALSNVQNTNNRGAAGVMFVDNTQAKVYGNDDVAVFTLTPLTDATDTGNEKHFLFHTNNGKTNAATGYLHVGSNDDNTLLTEAEEDAMGNDVAVITIDADGRAHIHFNYSGQDNRYLQYWNRDRLFSTYKSEYDDRAVYIYFKNATPLATIEKEGTTDKQYTVADELVVVHAFGNKLWVKDQGNLSIAKREKPEGQIDYMREVAASGKPNADLNVMTEVLKQEGEWDQSNWAIIEFLNSDMTEDVVAGYKGKFIKPASITGIYSDDLNYTIQVPATVSKNEVDAWIGDAAEYTPNVYCAANFLSANLTDNGVAVHSETAPEVNTNAVYFFMNPKVQEVFTVTYAVWDGNKFTLPAKYGESVNGANLHGAFNIDWRYNGGTPTLTTGEAYQFKAVMNRPATGGSGAPRKINGTGDSADSNFLVMPLGLTGSGNVVTAIDDVNTANREVVGVEYYNVAGQRSDRPVEGVNIVVTRYSDGSTSTAKVLK